MVCRILDRTIFEHYWSYYLSIEKMLKDTERYVAISYENKDTYSIEFTKIILLACSEIDSIFKIICKLKGDIKEDDKKYKMKAYAIILEEFDEQKEFTYTIASNTFIEEKVLAVAPFSELDKSKLYGGLSWWKDYQQLKHNRLQNAIKGNLFNALSSVVAYYILINILKEFLEEADGKEYVKEHNISEYLVPSFIITDEEWEELRKDEKL